MRTATWKRAVQFNRVYSKNSWRNFKRFFELCCQAHQADAPYFSSALDLLSKDDWRGIVDLADSLSSQTYDDARQHFLANQFSLLVRKYPFPPKILNLDPERRAINTFMRTERRCYWRNKMFRLINGTYTSSSWFNRAENDILNRMRSWILGVLSPEPDLAKILDSCEFGPGASLGVHGNATNRARKILSKSWSVTPEAQTLVINSVWVHAQLRELILSRPGERAYCVDPVSFRRKMREKLTLVYNNKITFVPKTVKTARSIAVEPLMNGFIQKGIDSFMRLRLKRVGVHLDDQSLNQALSRQGSLPGSEGFSTIDLSSASDSLATEVVRCLLPPAWFQLLNAVRSKHGVLPDGSTIKYEKFCSMGNGFCFPLESLIFSAAVAVCGGKLGVDALVYGDDIIVKPAIASDVIRLLSFLGFKTNREKTFLHGPFRESCGADWFGGEDVRPFTLKYEIDSLQSVFKTLNLVQRNSRTRDFFDFLDFDSFQVPQNLRLVRPYNGPVDTAVTVELDTFLASPFSRFDRQLQCFAWTELSPESVKDKEIAKDSAYPYALVYAALSGSSSEAPFTMRRMSRTKSRRKSGSGPPNTWLPPLQSA